MGEKNIGVFGLKSQLEHSAQQRFYALRKIKARINEQIPLASFPFDHITVEPLQGTVGEDYGENP